MLTTVTEAWHTLAPPAGDRHGPLSTLLLALTVVTGLVDSFSYLVLGHVFVANMTGNVVFLALALAGAKGFSVGVHVVALASFSLGAVASGRLVTRIGERRGRVLAVAAACESALVATAWAIGVGAGNPGSGVSRYLLVVLLAVTGGLQTGTARWLAVPDLITTVLTRTIAGAGFDSRLAGGSDSHVGRRGLMVAAMFGGALVGAALVLHVSRSLALLAPLGLLVVVMLTLGRQRRTRPAWDRPG
ncbi:MAG TPA: YoaK family protein [Acidimicrobiales bacterium]|jgi:uncharacterized membrane protein YoaK (UPF0700 family)|nr:YoaK family protein [Acidimicrobiales bacterium]